MLSRKKNDRYDEINKHLKLEDVLVAGRNRRYYNQS